MKKFIHYLDNYKYTNEMQPVDYIPLLDQMNMNFIKQQLSKTNRHIYNPISNYALWQIQHDHTFAFDKPFCFQPFPPPIEIPKKPKIYKEIDVKIDSIEDLLHIIEKYPYDDSIQYNININILRSVRQELQDLHNMVGLSTFKTQILDQLLYFLQDLHIIDGSSSDYKHTVLYGPPGTGKTEIAKIIGQMYSKIGILPSKTFKKVTRADLIAGYLGQTAIKTQKVIESSLGGVLFIDEAYSLADSEQRDSFSKECIDTLCEALSQYKDNWLVIIAGYEDEIKQNFFKTNPGLESRFIWRFTLDAYSPTELFAIFKQKVEGGGWKIENMDPKIGERWFSKNKSAFPFLGRDMEALFTYTKIAHSRRIFGLAHKLPYKLSDNVACNLSHKVTATPLDTSPIKKQITIEDMNKGFESFERFSKTKPEKSVLHDMYC